MRKLFRQEAIDAQREKLLGEVSIARPVPLWVFTLLAVIAAVALLVFAFWGEYTRRERVEGFLALDAGVARLLAPAAGSLAEVMVHEGEEVAAGSPVARLSLEQTTAAGLSPNEVVQREMNKRLGALESEREQTRLLAAQQGEQLRQRVADLQKEIVQADAEIRLQQSRVGSASEELARTEKLVNEKFFSDTAAAAKRNDLLDQQVRLETARRGHAALERELRAAQAEMPSVGIKMRTQQDQIARQQSELQQSLAQEEARREVIIRAPIAGTVTNIAVARGDSVAADAPLATVLPRGSGLRAQLLVPTRAIGFVQPGNEVILRYEAFPFQRFGQYRGVVDTVSRTVWSPGEKIGSMAVREPVYRIDVKLDRQSVSVAGQDIPLRPGMMVGADILLERRTVFEWVFEPVLELRARLIGGTG